MTATDRPSIRGWAARDRLRLAAAAFFALALAFAAYPALRPGAPTLGGALLLVGLAGVAMLAVIAVRGASEPSDGLAAERLADLLDGEAACVLGDDGRVLGSNAAWREIAGTGPRLGPGADAYALLKAATADGAARGELRIADAVRSARASLLPGRRLLLRLETPAPATGGAASPPPSAAPAPRPLETFVGGAPFGAIRLSGSDPREAVIAEANAAAVALCGDRARPSARLADLFEPGSWAEAGQRMAQARSGPFDFKLADTPARSVQLYLTSADGGLVAYLLDVTEQKQIELQLAQSEKMRAIGQLAGGVAHDFNNLLTAIQLRLDELLQRHPVGDPSYEGLNEIRQTAVRAADLVRKLLTHARKQTVQRETLELGELISEIEVLLRRLLREDVRLETDYGRNLPLVRADKSQLETAVMNLAVNARDAVRAQGGGVVKIRTARLSLEEARALGFADQAAGTGDVALIEVSDNGPGIPPDVMTNIFVPFFTTKAVGEGTGLGLATVYGIVKQADGWIHVESEPGSGAAFRIFLPVHAPSANAPEEPKPVQPARPVARDLSGAGRILFVEDEDIVRGVAARLLRARGYEVIEAADGEAALLLAEENAGKIDLLISDVIMPGMDGPSLLKKARPYLGSAPVMFISGYAEAEFSDLLEDEPGVTFLPKPIDIKVLAERVKQQIEPARS